MCPPTLKRWVIDAHSSAGGPFGGAVSTGGMVARERDIGKRPARLPLLGARDRYVAARCGPSAAAAFRLPVAGAVPLASARGPGLALASTDCRCENCRRPVRAEPGGRWSVAAASAPSAGDRASHLPLFAHARARDQETGAPRSPRRRQRRFGIERSGFPGVALACWSRALRRSTRRLLPCTAP